MRSYYISPNERLQFGICAFPGCGHFVSELHCPLELQTGQGLPSAKLGAVEAINRKTAIVRIRRVVFTVLLLGGMDVPCYSAQAVVGIHIVQELFFFSE